MVTIFNRVSIYFGYDLYEYRRILDALDREHIKFDTKTKDARMGQSPGRGSFGELSNYQITYEIFVHKKDAEIAEFCVASKES